MGAKLFDYPYMKPCEFCGETFACDTSTQVHIKRFCAAHAHPSHRAPLRDPNRDRHVRVQTNCTLCNDTIWRFKFDLKKSTSRPLCKPCFSAEIGRIGRLKKDPEKWTTITCAICEKQVERMKRYADRAHVKLCSKACKSEAIARKMVAPYTAKPKPVREPSDHYFYYGADWQSQRDAACARDRNTCQHCGEVEGDRKWHVHHIVRFLDFESSTDANVLSNLVTLCPPCHRKADCEMLMKRRAEGRPVRRKLRDPNRVRNTSTRKFASMAEVVCLLASHWKVSRETKSFAGICVGGLDNSIHDAGTDRGRHNSRGLYLAKDRCQVTSLGRANAEIEAGCWRFTLANQGLPDPRSWADLHASGDNVHIVRAERTHYLDWQDTDTRDYVVTTSSARNGKSTRATKREWHV